MESEVYPGLWANVQIAENLINLLFTDVAFRRDSEGDRSGHYESGGGGGHVPPVPSAICAPVSDETMS